MRLALRLVWMLAVGLTLISLIFSWQQIRREKRNAQRDAEHRMSALAESVSDKLEPAISTRSNNFIQATVDRFARSHENVDVMTYDSEGTLIARSGNDAHFFGGVPNILRKSFAKGDSVGQFETIDGALFYVYLRPLREDQTIIGGVILAQDSSYLNVRIQRLLREAALRIVLQLVFITAITVVIVRRNVLRPLATTMRWIKSVQAGRNLTADTDHGQGIFSEFADEVSTLARDLSHARASAELEARLRDASDSTWTPERLSAHVRTRLPGKLVVVANREPYMHRRNGRSIETIIPASGLVTALEPILNACDGTWVAHGSGDADRETVDRHDRLRVPPDSPRYTLRRVWLSKMEEEGYYYGFSNEGMWPLCHIAHTRPMFRSSDWEEYQAVNRKFADVVLEEIEGCCEPIVLVQDYHFALLPRLIKERRPDARVAIFWHIPWPNPEAFGICPWQAELLDGLLGADLIGFHIQVHCHNFLETVDRALECRIDWPSSTATRQDHQTVVKPFPISVDFQSLVPDIIEDAPSYYVGQPALLKELGIEALYLGVGVDRVDYTKGIPERFAGIERFLEKYPQYIGKFTFVQIGAPSRTHIPRYQSLNTEVYAEAERINWRFKTQGWRPIILLDRHHSHEEISRFYRFADLCLVTSLHDGMNLVAKEFVATRSDEEGTLILSRFAGAAHELRDAIIVNPYASDEIAEAIRLAIEMHPDERRRRMRSMRKYVQEQNIYHWAGSLMGELMKLQVEPSKKQTLAVENTLAARTASTA